MKKGWVYFKKLRFATFLIVAFTHTLFLFCCRDGQREEASDLIDTVEALLDTTLEAEVLPDSLLLVLEDLKNDTSLRHASLAYIIHNITQDSLIASHNEHLSLVPASVMKLMTTATALEVLGPNRRFVTRLAYHGKVIDSILYGDIYIIGGGDPALGSGTYGDARFIEQWSGRIRQLGIDSITGDIIADPRIFSIDAIPYTWSWGYLGLPYAAGAYGINVYDNKFSFELPEHIVGLFSISPPAMSPYVPWKKFIREQSAHTSVDNSVRLISLPYSNYTVIRGTIPFLSRPQMLSATINDPGLLLAYQLKESLRRKAIGVGGSHLNIFYSDAAIPPADSLVIINEKYSPSVHALVNNVNVYSNNLFSEALLKHIGLARFGTGDTETGARAVVNHLKNRGLSTEGFYMYDGSGLSRFNAMSVKHLLELLVYMKETPLFNIFFNSLAVAGEAGTLRNFCKDTDAAGRITAKSGTMTRVKSYAGYALTSQNDTLAFAVIANNYTCESREMTRKFEKVMVRMVNNDLHDFEK